MATDVGVTCESKKCQADKAAARPPHPYTRTHTDTHTVTFHISAENLGPEPTVTALWTPVWPQPVIFFPSKKTHNNMFCLFLSVVATKSTALAAWFWDGGERKDEAFEVNGERRKQEMRTSWTSCVTSDVCRKGSDVFRVACSQHRPITSQGAAQTGQLGIDWCGGKIL